MEKTLKEEVREQLAEMLANGLPRIAVRWSSAKAKPSNRGSLNA